MRYRLKNVELKYFAVFFFHIHVIYLGSESGPRFHLETLAKKLLDTFNLLPATFSLRVLNG
jgi:hypothetical protein